MADELRARVEELERKMDMIAKWVDPNRSGYASPQLHRDLTTPPPKPRPKIEVVPKHDGYWVQCGNFRYGVFAGWSMPPHGTNFRFEADARAIAAAITAAGNYPAEYQETSR